MRGTFSDLLIGGKRGVDGSTDCSGSCVLTVGSTWDGEPLPQSEHVRVVLTLDADTLGVAVEAPYFGDPAPPGLPGPTPNLWDYEVVEAFLLGADARYLEIELSPHGHYLALELRGRRSVVRSGMELRFEATRDADRWRGEASIPSSWLPPRLHAVNAYAMHGVGSARRHCSAFGDPRAKLEAGRKPDFHRLECFGPLAWDD